eukprot:scaffold37703_cov61-Phaeocystis_antarctica.AAC.2
MNFASRSSLQFRGGKGESYPVSDVSPSRIANLRHSTAAASCSVLSCCRSACVCPHSSRLALLKATATRGSSTLHSWTKMIPSSSPLSALPSDTCSKSCARRSSHASPHVAQLKDDNSVTLGMAHGLFSLKPKARLKRDSPQHTKAQQPKARLKRDSPQHTKAQQPKARLKRDSPQHTSAAAEGTSETKTASSTQASKKDASLTARATQ